MSDITVFHDGQNALSTEVRSPLERAILGWLDAKGNKSHSERTRRAYDDTLADFRAALQAYGLDLDGDPAKLAYALQAWAGAKKPAPLNKDGSPRKGAGAPISNATFNLRCAIISSFYRYAKMKSLITGDNPAERVERRDVQPKQKFIDLKELSRKVKAIDRSTLEGKRDFALLSVIGDTSRRVSEVAALRRRHLFFVDDGARIVVTWPRTKGDKPQMDALGKAARAALLDYLQAQYGARLINLDADAPIWVSYSRWNKGAAITAQAIADVCQKRIGTSKVHTLRHAFARAADKAGMPVTAIQAKLGHSSLTTTTRYLGTLKEDENPFGDAIASLLGFGD